MRVSPLAVALLVPGIVIAAGTPKSHKHAAGPVKSSKEAKAIAEKETGGKATSARRVPLNGASSGWEVDVKMAHEAQGWRCIIDSDTHMVLSKTRIDQPGAKGRDEGPVRVVKGTK